VLAQHSLQLGKLQQGVRPPDLTRPIPAPITSTALGPGVDGS
jgi:hypothetical protein